MSDPEWRNAIFDQVKDAAKNFNIDVDKVLNQFLSNIDEALEVGDIDNSINSSTLNAAADLKFLNFSEAAMVVQKTASIWSKKIDHLTILADKTLKTFKAEKRGKKVKDKDANDQQEENDDQDDDDDDITLNMPKIKLLKDVQSDLAALSLNRQVEHIRDAEAILAVKPSVFMEEENKRKGHEMKEMKKESIIGYYREFYKTGITIYTFFRYFKSVDFFNPFLLCQ